MKKIFFFAMLMLSSTLLLGQTAYIEVKGELDLSIYLNSKFKGKITDDAGIFIIENVTHGKNLIKIVKEGYTPFEETIIVKPNEVLAYKVKPFTKHKVYVSEEGNTAETAKKATVKTGKLIVQSVPIEIKITIPDIEGISKSAKTKDKWQAEEIPVGSYKITFTYNQKVITKTIEVLSNETTSLFVNMLNGDFKASNTLNEREIKEKAELKKKIEGEENFMKYYYFKYYTIGQTLEEAKAKYPDFYKKTEKFKYKNNPQFDKIYTSDISSVKIMVKDEKVVGCWAYVQGRVEDDSNFTKGNKAISELVNELKNEFYFNPKETKSSYNKDGYKYDSVTYTWEKNRKSIVVGYTKWYFSNGYTTEIMLTQMDPQ